MNESKTAKKGVLLAALLALGVGACSSSGGSPSPTRAATSSSGTSASSSSGSGVSCGTATTLASNQMGAGGLAISGNTLIWTTCPTCVTNLNGSGDIMTLPTSGGTPTVLAASQDNSASIVANATNVYWSAPTDGNIMTIPLSGGTATALYKNVNAPQFVAIDSTSIYWNGAGGIVKGPIAGGTRQKISNSPGNSRNVVVNATSAFWQVQGSNSAFGSIATAPLDQDGGAPKTLAPQQTPEWITADSANVYWPNSGTQAEPALTPAQDPGIMKVAATGGTPTMLVDRNPNVPSMVAVDATNVYWIEAAINVTTTAYVYEMPLTGGTPKCLAPGPILPGGLVVDATNVYWTATDSGVVAKAPK